MSYSFLGFRFNLCVNTQERLTKLPFLTVISDVKEQHGIQRRLCQQQGSASEKYNDTLDVNQVIFACAINI